MTKSLEDYLEAIHCLIKETGSAHVADIARVIGVKMPSVSSAVKELSKLGLVIYERYQSVKLTELGEKSALVVYERHKLLKDFLMYLGVSDEVAESDACSMEHILSSETISKIKEFTLYVNKSKKK